MKSGVWILIVVIIAGVAIGYAFKDRLKPAAQADAAAELRAIGDLTDPAAKIGKLERFIVQNPTSDQKSRAYSMIAKEMLTTQKDTTAFIDYARAALAKETDAESKAMLYYSLYNVDADRAPEKATAIGTELMKTQVDASWIYNYIGYDLAERGRDLDLALSLTQKSVELAKTRDDSAMGLDSHGYVYFKKGMYKEAIPDFEKSVDLYSEPYEDGLRHLADAYLRAGEPTKAVATYRRILVMGEYEYARAAVDSIQTAVKYTPEQKRQFDEGVWQDRVAAAKPAVAFSLANLAGEMVSFDPAKGGIVLLNFSSPT